jgi:hypothetical protein
MSAEPAELDRSSAGKPYRESMIPSKPRDVKLKLPSAFFSSSAHAEFFFKKRSTGFGGGSPLAHWVHATKRLRHNVYCENH